MADQAQDKHTRTEDLAERVIGSAMQGSDLTPFRDEIASLPLKEQLQFVRDLSSTALNQRISTIGNDDKKRFDVDAKYDLEAGHLIDIDLIEGGKDGVITKRTDLLTPGKEGEAFDKMQEIDSKLSPYKTLFYRLQARDNSLDRDYADRRDWSAIRLANFMTVNESLSEFAKEDPDLGAMKEALKLGTINKDWRPDRYVRIGEFSTLYDSPKGPPELQNMIDGIPVPRPRDRYYYNNRSGGYYDPK